MALTEKRKLFADEYLIDLNASRAYRVAYPRVKDGDVAAAAASRLLKIKDVSEYISVRMQERSERTEITQDQVLNELANIAFADATNYAKIVEKDATVQIDGKIFPLLDDKGNVVKYRTVEPKLTDELTDDQKKAIAVIKKGRDGFEIKPYDKLKALELLGKHLGMFADKVELDADMDLNITIDYGEDDTG